MNDLKAEGDYNAWLQELHADPKFWEFEEELAQQRIERAFQALVELRRRHSDFMKKLVVTILVPRCENCYSYDHPASEPELYNWRSPDIVATTWKRDLVRLGATRNETRRITHDPDFVLDCVSCSSSMTYGRDNIYLEREPFESYFRDLIPEEPEAQKRKAPKWMKRLVYKVYRGRCFGCKRRLTWDEKSTDHVLPHSSGGLSELSNLQLLCRRCDGELKKDRVPTEELVDLFFLILPADGRFRVDRLW